MPTATSFAQLAAARYSVRQFSPQPVEPEKLAALLEMARVAPTAGNRQPQRLLVVTRAEGLAKIDAATGCRFGAPVVVIVGYDTAACWVRSSFDHAKSGEVDAAIITTHLMLQATALGLGSVWVMHFDPARLAEGFPFPENFAPVALLPLGYAAPGEEPSARHTLRKPLTETVAWERF